MADKANMTYTLVEDRNARTAFSQVSAEITAIKRTLAKLEASLDNPGYGAASVSSASEGVTFDIRETASGLVVLTLQFFHDLAETPSYVTLMTLGNGFPKLAVAASLAYLSPPPAAGNVSCYVLPSGEVNIGASAGTGAITCVATAVWKRR